MLSLATYAQRFDNTNSSSRIARVLYTEDNNHFFKKNSNVDVDCVDGVKKIYAYDKNKRKLYLYTENGNYEITVDKQTHKLYKDDYNLPRFKSKECEDSASSVDKMLVEAYNDYNSVKEDSINCAKIDSIKKVKYLSYSKILKGYEKELIPLMKRYAANRDWHWAPNPFGLYCLLCDKYIKSDFIYCYAINKDTLYVRDYNHLDFNTYYVHIHKAIKPSTIRKPLYDMHCQVFKDSLSNANIDGRLEVLNELLLMDGYNQLSKKVPYGFIKDYSWSDDYGNVSLQLTYTNTSNKTIKYLNAYFCVYNAVDDIRCKGYVSGTGPVEPWASGSWNWDYTGYSTASDSKYLNIDKIVLTYMDGTKRTISNIKYHSEYDDKIIEDEISRLNQPPKNTYFDEEWMKDWEELQRKIDDVNKQIEEVTKPTNAPPMFIGGYDALKDYIKTHTRYPPVAAENGIEGVVKVQFVVKKDGTIGNVKVIKGVDSSLDKEAIRVVSAMPKFIPGRKYDQPCDCKMSTDVGFRLQ